MRLPILLFVLIFSKIVSASDTIRPVSFEFNCAHAGNIPLLVTFKTPLGGYVCGNSVLNTPEKAQKYYWSDSSKTLTAVAFWFGQKIQSGSPGLIKAKVYRVNPVTGGPSALIAESLTKPVSAIDTSDNLTVVSFASPTLLPDTFFIALDLSLLNPGDSIGLLSTRDSCYSGEQLAWEKDSTGAWVPFNDGTTITSWGLNIDMAILPVGDFGLHTAIEELPAKDFISYPNPASESIFIDLEKENQYAVRLLDLHGKIVYHSELRLQREKIDVTPFNPGIYFLQIMDGYRSGTKKILIAR